MDLITVLLILLLLMCVPIAFSEWYRTHKSTKFLNEIKDQHEVTLSFVSVCGCLAFSDSEQKLYIHYNSNGSQIVISYDKIIQCQATRNPTDNVSLWALTPTYTRYECRAGGDQKLPDLKNKLTSIIANNYQQAHSEYAMIATIPHHAVCVTYGDPRCSILLPIPNWKPVCIWDERDTLYVLPAFDLRDFKERPEMYTLISIAKDCIVHHSIMFKKMPTFVCHHKFEGDYFIKVEILNSQSNKECIELLSADSEVISKLSKLLN